MTRRCAGWIAGFGVTSFGTIFVSAILGAPGLKDPPAGPPMSEEQIREVINEKGELAWADGQFRLKVKKVEGRDLLYAELIVMEDGKVRSTVKARLARVRVKPDQALLYFYVDEAEITTREWTVTVRSQEWDLPAPRQGKKP